jgi:DNA-binding MarR family transcriptional regulator
MTRQTTSPGTAPADRIARECIAVRLRMINRVVTKLYDEALRPHGVRISQMNILVVVARQGATTPARIAERLYLDKSTLSRDVNVMCARGWLEKVRGGDARTHGLRLTRAGMALLHAASPAWETAQRRARAVLGGAGVARVARVAKTLWAGGGK